MLLTVLKQYKFQKREARELNKRLLNGLELMEKQEELSNKVFLYKRLPFKNALSDKAYTASQMCSVFTAIMAIFLGFFGIVGLSCFVSLGNKETLNALLIIEIVNTLILTLSTVMIVLSKMKSKHFEREGTFEIEDALQEIKDCSISIGNLLSDVPSAFRKKEVLIQMIKYVNKGSASSMDEAIKLYQNKCFKTKNYRQLKGIKNQITTEVIGV